MLLMTREHLTPSTSRDAKQESSVKEYAVGAKNSPYTGVSKFVPTTRKIVEFSANRRDPKVRHPFISTETDRPSALAQRKDCVH